VFSSEVDDRDAIETLKRGDPEGMDALVAAHQARALRVAYHITRDSQAAEDVVADAFLAVFQKIKSQDPDRPFQPWLLRIVVNRAISLTRRQSRLQRVLGLLSRATEPSDPVQVAETNDETRAVISALDRLPVNERAALSLRYLEDLDERSVAEILGWPIGTVKTRLHRGRNHLRQELARNATGADSPALSFIGGSE
jgi:RNA polymerase sigma-70 factor (ECF subfamily)